MNNSLLLRYENKGASYTPRYFFPKSSVLRSRYTVNMIKEDGKTDLKRVHEYGERTVFLDNAQLVRSGELP